MITHLMIQTLELEIQKQVIGDIYNLMIVIMVYLTLVKVMVSSHQVLQLFHLLVLE